MSQAVSRFMILCLAISVSFACQKKNDDPAKSDLELFAHDPNQCPPLSKGTYYLAGLPEDQKTSLRVVHDNQTGSAVEVGIESEYITAHPDGQVHCKEPTIRNDNRICHFAGCNSNTFIVSYSGVVNGSTVRGKTVVRPRTSGSIEVTENRANQSPITRRYNIR